MFSQTAEYALRVMVYLAGRQGRPATIKQIAATTKVPEGYLAKVLLSLSRASLIHSQRGLHGGSVLLRPPDQISVFDVLEAVDPIRRIRTCPLGIASHGVHLCPLHRRMDHAIGLVESAFRESTIADLLADPNPSRPLCDALLPQEVEQDGEAKPAKAPSKSRSAGKARVARKRK